MIDTRSDIPIPQAPLLSADGSVSEVWWRFFLTIFNRTGAEFGGDLAAVATEVAGLLDAQFGAQETSLGVVSTHSLHEAGNLPNVYCHGLYSDGDLHAVVNQSVNGFMAANDKIKLDSITLPIFQPVVITSDIVDQNSTVDVNVLSVNIPANTLSVGNTFSSEFMMLVSGGALAGNLNIWMKVNAVKLLTATIALPALGIANAGVRSSFRWTIRSLGAAGTVQISGTNIGPNTLLTSGTIVNTSAASINTTVPNVFTIGVNWSAANAANIMTAKTGLMYQEK